MKNSVLSVFSVVSFYSRLINTPSKNLVRYRGLMLSNLITRQGGTKLYEI